MKVTAAIELNFAKKFIKEAWQKLKTVDPSNPIEKMFQKYGYGRTKRKYRIILKMNGSPQTNTTVVVPKPLLQFLDTASENWARVKGKSVKLAFENYVTGTLYNTLEPTVPLDKRGPTYFAKLLSLNRKNLGEEQYEELRQLYDNDRQRAPATRKAVGQKYIVVISRHPYDILGYSSGRDWTSSSCLSISGCNFDNYMKDEVAGSLVAFLVPSEDFVMARIDRQTHQYPDIPKVKYSKIDKTKKNKLNPAIETYRESDTVEHRPEGTWDAVFRKKLSAFDVLSRPIARIAIKPYYNEEGDMILYPGREYGQAPTEFKKRLSRFVWLHNRKQPTGNYHLAAGLYPDYNQPATVFFTSSANVDKDDFEELLQSPVAPPNFIEQVWNSLDHTNFYDRLIAIRILKNPGISRKMIAEAFNVGRQEYLTELAVHHFDSLGPVFLRYILRQPKVALHALVSGYKAAINYLTEDEVYSFINDFRSLNQEEVKILVQNKPQVIENLLNKGVPLASFARTLEDLDILQPIQSKKIEIARQAAQGIVTEDTINLVESDSDFIDNLPLCIRVVFKMDNRTIRDIVNTNTDRCAWHQLPDKALHLVLAFASNDTLYSVRALNQIVGLLDAGKQDMLHQYKLSIAIHDHVTYLSRYPQIATVCNITTAIDPSPLLMYCKAAVSKGHTINTNYVNYCRTEWGRAQFLTNSSIELSRIVPVPADLLPSRIATQFIEDGGKVVIHEKNDLSDLMGITEFPASVTKNQIDYLTFADFTKRGDYGRVIELCLQLCLDNKLTMQHIIYLLKEYATYKDGLELSNGLVNKDGYVQFLLFLEKAYESGVNVTPLVAVLPKYPQKFNLPLYNTSIDVAQNMFLHYTHLNRVVTDKDTFILDGPENLHIGDVETVWKYLYPDTPRRSQYAPDSIPKCAESIIDWFNIVRTPRYTSPPSYLVATISDIDRFNTDSRNRLRTAALDNKIILSKAAYLNLEIFKPYNIDEVPKLLSIEGISLYEMSGDNFSIFLTWVKNYPKQYAKAVKKGKFKRLFVYHLTDATQYYELLSHVAATWSLPDYKVNSMHNALIEEPRLSSSHIDSIIDLIDTNEYHSPILTALLEQFNSQQAERYYEIAVKRCEKYKHLYRPYIMNSYIFGRAFGQTKGIEYYNRLHELTKRETPKKILPT